MSYKEGCFPIFLYTQEEKDEIRKELGLKEVTIQEDVDALIEWFEKQPHLNAAGVPEREFFEKMLIFAKGSREKTKTRIDNFYKYRALTPEIFDNRIKLLDSDQAMWSFYRQATICNLYNLKRVTVFKLIDADTRNYDSNAILRAAMILGDLRLRYDYMLGDIWVIDMTLGGLGHLLRTNAYVLQKATQIFQDGMGIRIFAIHVLGAPGLVQHVIKFFSAFVKPKIMERVMFHNSLEDLQKHVHKKYLPLEFGGDLPSMGEHVDKTRKLIREEDTKKFLAECNLRKSDEKLRPDQTIHEEYLNGSFKKLEID